jgi:hypothetical protein
MALGDIYEKVGGAWVIRGNISGPPGPEGPPGADSSVPGPPGPAGIAEVWYQGAAAPGSGVGATGDWYLEAQVTTPGVPAYVTALPSSPVDGMEVYFDADPPNGPLWHLRYRASLSTYKWEYVGGAPLRWQSGYGGNVIVDWPTVDLWPPGSATYPAGNNGQLTLPPALSGVWNIQGAAFAYSTPAGTAAYFGLTRFWSVGLSPGTPGPLGNNDYSAVHAVGGYQGDFHAFSWFPTLPTNSKLGMWAARTAGQGMRIDSPTWYTVQPIRVI